MPQRAIIYQKQTFYHCVNLGVLVDKSLTWKYYHIDATAKIRKTIGLISNLWNSIPRHIYTFINYSTVMPFYHIRLRVAQNTRP